MYALRGPEFEIMLEPQHIPVVEVHAGIKISILGHAYGHFDFISAFGLGYNFACAIAAVAGARIVHALAFEHVVAASVFGKQFLE